MWLKGYYRGYFVYVKCETCGGQTKPFHINEKEYLENKEYWGNLVASEKAVRAWNRRKK